MTDGVVPKHYKHCPRVLMSCLQSVSQSQDQSVSCFFLFVQVPFIVWVSHVPHFFVSSWSVSEFFMMMNYLLIISVRCFDPNTGFDHDCRISLNKLHASAVCSWIYHKQKQPFTVRSFYIVHKVRKYRKYWYKLHADSPYCLSLCECVGVYLMKWILCWGFTY